MRGDGHTGYRFSVTMARNREERHFRDFRRFGRTGGQVSEIGHGMWGLAGWSGADCVASAAGTLPAGLCKRLHEHRGDRNPTSWPQ